ncbi:MAG: hypothetical protein KDC13_10285, partial [Bacteroidetes bacterium]|nr:hypothetical protein [Bacteroidota bacterium]
SAGIRALRDWLLSRPVLIGRLGMVFPALINWLNKNLLNRRLMHMLAGIHYKKVLPKVHFHTFGRWFRKRKANRKPDVWLFPTCYVNYNDPQIGKDAITVLEKNGLEPGCCGAENCCGAPQLDRANFKEAAKWAWNVIENHKEAIDNKQPILAINPTCSLTMRKEYPGLFKDELKRNRAEKFSGLVKDFSEYLWELKQAEKFNRDFKSSPGGTVYHAACHLRAQGIGFRSRDLLRLIPDNPISFVDECSCHDGTFAFKKEYFDLSMKYGKEAFQRIAEETEKLCVSDCPLAAMQIKQGANLKQHPKHPITVLAEAYEEKKDG